MSNDAKLIICNCQEHALVLRSDDYGDMFDVDLAIWGPTRKGRLPLRHRVREAWRAFRTGEPYTEWLSVSSVNDLRDIANFCNDFADKHGGVRADQLHVGDRIMLDPIPGVDDGPQEAVVMALRLTGDDVEVEGYKVHDRTEDGPRPFSFFTSQGNGVQRIGTLRGET